MCGPTNSSCSPAELDRADRLVRRRRSLDQSDRGVVLQDPVATLVDEHQVLVHRTGKLRPADGDVGLSHVRAGGRDVGHVELLGEVPVAVGLPQVGVGCLVAQTGELVRPRQLPGHAGWGRWRRWGRVLRQRRPVRCTDRGQLDLSQAARHCDGGRDGGSAPDDGNGRNTDGNQFHGFHKSPFDAHGPGGISRTRPHTVTRLTWCGWCKCACCDWNLCLRRVTVRRRYDSEGHGERPAVAPASMWGPGISDPSHPGAAALFDRLLQALRPDVGPVLLDVVEALRTGGLAENDAPAGRNVGEDRPQAVLVLVVDEHDKGAVVVIEGVDAHRVSLLSGIWNYPWSIPTLGQKAFPSSLDWETRALG